MPEFSANNSPFSLQPSSPLHRRQYLALIPLRLWNWPAPLPSVESVLATVVDHPLALANQPPAKHALRFLKVWLGKLERVGTVDCSELYERIAVLVVRRVMHRNGTSDQQLRPHRHMHMHMHSVCLSLFLVHFNNLPSPPPISIPTTLSASPAPAPAPCARLATLTLKVGAINHTGCLQMQQSPCTNQPRWSPRQQRACAPGTARSPWQSGCLSIEACLQANVWLSLGQGLVWRVQHTHIDTYTHRHPHPHPHPHTYRNTHHLTGV